MSKVKVAYHSSTDSEYEDISSNQKKKVKLQTEQPDCSKKGIAVVMGKILKKKMHKPVKTPILCKGKTDKALASRKTKSTEHLSSDEDSQHDSVDSENERPNLSEKRLRTAFISKAGRVKPNPVDKEKERRLSRIATKGVVQLFNAVRKQQTTMETDLKTAGPSVRRQEQVLSSVSKGTFLDILHGKKIA